MAVGRPPSIWDTRIERTTGTRRTKSFRERIFVPGRETAGSCHRVLSWRQEGFVTEQRRVKLFRNGRNQAVRIPVEFELPGDEAIMHRDGDRW